MKFLIFTEFGELLDLAMWLKDVEKQEVVMHIPNHEYSKIGDGIIDKEKNWWKCIDQGYIWVFDGCSYGNLQDRLRSKGELVFGGCENGDKLQNDRQLGQAWFKAAGFKQPESKNFKSIEDAIKFVEKNSEKRWILKQNGDAPKSLNHMGKFVRSVDMIYHLEELKKGWNEQEFGKFDCDLMEVVEGLELAASAFFNGSDYLRNKDGKVVGFLNFEEKKEADGHTGETTGEMGTTFLGVDENNPIFSEILMKPKILEGLRNAKFRGVFDINCIKTKEGIVALEATCRFGVPATSYEFMEGLTTSASQLIKMVASGDKGVIGVRPGIGMVMVVAAKPYPLEVEVPEEGTSVGERLWLLTKGNPHDNMSPEQQRRIHLENFEKADGVFKVATRNGYLLTVTGVGATIEKAREDLIQYIKDNIYISGMKYRTDIGERVEESGGTSTKHQMMRKFEKEKADIENRHKNEIATIKGAIEKAVYGE